jgi:transcriptional regulator with XRE-family HTH domain
MKKKIRKDMGNRLRTLREQLGLNQREFAAKMGMVNTYISALETAYTGPGYYSFYQLAKYHKISPLYLLHGIEPAFIDQEKKQEEPKIQEKEPEPGKKAKPGPPTFGNDNPQIKEMLSYFERSPMVKHSVLGFFAKFVIEYKDLIEKDIEIHGTTATVGA